MLLLQEVDLSRSSVLKPVSHMLSYPVCQQFVTGFFLAVASLLRSCEISTKCWTKCWDSSGAWCVFLLLVLYQERPWWVDVGLGEGISPCSRLDQASKDEDKEKPPQPSFQPSKEVTCCVVTMVTRPLLGGRLWGQLKEKIVAVLKVSQRKSTLKLSLQNRGVS